MTKKEYIETHEMEAIHNITPWLAYGCHGIDGDYAYISKIINGFADSYHKVKIKYDKNDRAYMMVTGVKLYADDFWAW